jgi:hypothetical protein
MIQKGDLLCVDMGNRVFFWHSEWAVNIHRDSYASYCGHHSMLGYFAIAENESIGRVRYNFMQVEDGKMRPTLSFHSFCWLELITQCRRSQVESFYDRRNPSFAKTLEVHP